MSIEGNNSVDIIEEKNNTNSFFGRICSEGSQFEFHALPSVVSSLPGSSGSVPLGYYQQFFEKTFNSSIESASFCFNDGSINTLFKHHSNYIGYHESLGGALIISLLTEVDGRNSEPEVRAVVRSLVGGVKAFVISAFDARLGEWNERVFGDGAGILATAIERYIASIDGNTVKQNEENSANDLNSTKTLQLQSSTISEESRAILSEINPSSEPSKQPPPLDRTASKRRVARRSSKGHKRLALSQIDISALAQKMTLIPASNQMIAPLLLSLEEYKEPRALNIDVIVDMKNVKQTDLNAIFGAEIEKTAFVKNTFYLSRKGRVDSQIFKESSAASESVTSSSAAANSNKSAEALAEKRQSIIAELIETEKNYVCKLAVIDQLYIKQLLPTAHVKSKDGHVSKGSLLTKGEYKAIFSDIATIKPVNDAMYRDLALIAEKPSLNALAGILEKHVHSFQVYKNYTTSYSDSIATIKRAEAAKKDFATFLSKARNHSSAEKMTLFDLLIMPIQRIPRYILLMKDLIRNTEPSHPEIKSLQDAEAKLEAIAAHINDAQKQSEAVNIMFSLQDEIEDLPSIISSSRWYVDRLDVHDVTPLRSKDKIGAASRDKTLFLFNDCLIVTKNRELNAELMEAAGTASTLSKGLRKLKRDRKKYKYLAKIDLRSIKLSSSSHDNTGESGSVFRLSLRTDSETGHVLLDGDDSSFIPTAESEQNNSVGSNIVKIILSLDGIKISDKDRFTFNLNEAISKTRFTDSCCKIYKNSSSLIDIYYHLIDVSEYSKTAVTHPISILYEPTNEFPIKSICEKTKILGFIKSNADGNLNFDLASVENVYCSHEESIDFAAQSFSASEMAASKLPSALLLATRILESWMPYSPEIVENIKMVLDKARDLYLPSAGNSSGDNVLSRLRRNTSVLMSSQTNPIGKLMNNLSKMSLNNVASGGSAGGGMKGRLSKIFNSSKMSIASSVAPATTNHGGNSLFGGTIHSSDFSAVEQMIEPLAELVYLIEKGISDPERIYSHVRFELVKEMRPICDRIRSNNYSKSKLKALSVEKLAVLQRLLIKDLARDVLTGADCNAFNELPACKMTSSDLAVEIKGSLVSALPTPSFNLLRLLCKHYLKLAQRFDLTERLDLFARTLLPLVWKSSSNEAEDDVRVNTATHSADDLMYDRIESDLLAIFKCMIHDCDKIFSKSL